MMSSPSDNVTVEPNRLSSKRHNDGSKILGTNPNSSTAANSSGCRVIEMNGDFAKVVSDPTRYVAIIVPRSLLSSIGALIDKANKTLDSDPIEVNNEPQQDSIQDDCSKFLKEFAELKETMVSSLHKCNEDELKQQVGQTEYDLFKAHRKELTKWYSTCQHLKSKLTSPSASNHFLKMRYNISPAVEDTGVRDSCLNKIKSTKDSMETALTHSVLSKATSLNDSVKGFFLAYNSDSEQIKPFMKALRVVLKNNGEWKSRPDRNSRPLRRQGNRGGRWFPPRRFPNNTEKTQRRRLTTRDDEDFPPPRRQNFTYRRFKRRPTNFTEDDEVFTEEDERPFRHFRRNTFRNRRY